MNKLFVKFDLAAIMSRNRTTTAQAVAKADTAPAAQGIRSSRA